MILSSANVFFASLVNPHNNAFDIVSQLVDSGADENDWREFKGAAFLHPDLAASDARVKKEQNETVSYYWSQNISAFSNSGGGLLIWGIDTKKNKASSVSLASKANVLRERLEELKVNAADPPVLGIETLAVIGPDGSAGFVVCLIPNSEHAPHRAVHCDGGYFIRAGDSSQSMKTEILRRMFYPRTFQRLVPRMTFNVSERNKSLQIYSVDARVTVENRGSASAREVVVVAACSVQSDFYPNITCWARQLAQNHFRCLQTIHPQEAIPLLDGWCTTQYSKNTMPASISYNITVMALDSSPSRFQVVFNTEDINSALTSEVVKIGVQIPFGSKG